MLGDLPLLQFYPRNWQSGFYDSVHPWLLYISVWHYWFWTGFIVLVNFYFIYLFKALTYHRADIRGKRAAGEKRRIAWPELLTCILPFCWALNVVASAFMYIRLIENGGGYAPLSIHVAGYQWGWRYAYPDSFYYKVLSNPISYGSNRELGSGSSILNLRWPDTDDWVEVFNKIEIPNSYYFAIEKQAKESITEAEEYLVSDFEIVKLFNEAYNNTQNTLKISNFNNTREEAYNYMIESGNKDYTYLLDDSVFLTQIIKDIISEFRGNISDFSEKYSNNPEIINGNETLIEDLPETVEQLLDSLQISPTIESVSKRLPYLYNDLITELYYCRWWLKTAGVLELERQNLIKNKVFQVGFWITGQGIDPNNPYKVEESESALSTQSDPLRLLRSTGSLILPTRVLIRFLGTSDDVTHSWAIPGIGLKMDCVPGRLFTVFTNISREGVYFGQCSELCGWNHYNMPISIYAIPFDHFIVWWELELHTIFVEPTRKYHYLYKFIENKEVDYSLLNVKYK